MLNTVLVDKPLPFATINISFISTCSKENFEVAKLSAVCWLDVSGKLEMSELPPGIVYDIFYVVKLTKGASAGWELPITLRLSLPDGRVLCRQLSLLMNVGSFQTVKGKTREEIEHILKILYERMPFISLINECKLSMNIFLIFLCMKF